VTAGSTAAGSTAAGSTGTAAAGSTTAGHIGLGTTAVGLMHGGHAAAIGSGIAKAGAVAAVLHPVAGIEMVGGLAWIAYRGKRGKR